MESQNRQLKWKLALLAGRPLAMAGILVVLNAAANRSSALVWLGVALIGTAFTLAWTAKIVLFLVSK